MTFVYNKLDKGSFVTGLFFDLSSAFDNLNSKFILDKCYSLCFPVKFPDDARFIDMFADDTSVALASGSMTRT